MVGFLCYNQIVMHLDDRDNTTFTTPWGTFMYEKNHFGPMNARATFQRAMDIAFVNKRDNFIVIYLDDMIMFSKSEKDNLEHIRQTFLKCRKFGLSLNPNNSLFSLQEGKLLGHIVSQEGVRIDLE